MSDEARDEYLFEPPQREGRQALPVVVGGIADWIHDTFIPEEHQDRPHNNWSHDWCAYRRDQRCYYPRQLDEKASEIAKYPVWIPEDRGYCPRHKWEEQEECPISHPGPNSGHPKFIPDQTRTWWEGGQKFSALQPEAAMGNDKWTVLGPGSHLSPDNKFEAVKYGEGSGSYWALMNYPPRGDDSIMDAQTLAEVKHYWSKMRKMREAAIVGDDDLLSLLLSDGTGEGLRALIEAHLDDDPSQVADFLDEDVSAEQVAQAMRLLAAVTQSQVHDHPDPIPVWRSGPLDSEVVSVTTKPGGHKVFGEATPHLIAKADVLADVDALVPAGTFAEAELFVRSSGLLPAPREAAIVGEGDLGIDYCIACGVATDEESGNDYCGDCPASPQRTAGAGFDVTVFRGIKVPDPLPHGVEDLLLPPMEKSEIDQHLGVGALLLEAFGGGDGLGRSWSRSRSVAEKVYGPGHLVVFEARAREADEDPTAERAGGYSNALENEWTAGSGAEVEVLGVYLPEHYYGGSRGNLLAAPVRMTAWRGGNLLKGGSRTAKRSPHTEGLPEGYWVDVADGGVYGTFAFYLRGPDGGGPMHYGGGSWGYMDVVVGDGGMSIFLARANLHNSLHGSGVGVAMAEAGKHLLADEEFAFLDSQWTGTSDGNTEAGNGLIRALQRRTQERWGSRGGSTTASFEVLIPEGQGDPDLYVSEAQGVIERIGGQGTATLARRGGVAASVIVRLTSLGTDLTTFEHTLRNTLLGLGSVDVFRTGSQQREAAWADVVKKAARIRSDGGVRILSAPEKGSSNQDWIVADVRGDTNVYRTELMKVAGGRSTAMWRCGCAWSAYSWGRSGRWKKYEGRMCVPPGTKVSMADGTTKPIENVEPGDWVLTHDGPGQVEQRIEREYDGPVQVIHTAGLPDPLVITPTHEVWAYGTPQRLRKPWQGEKGQGFKFYDESFLLDEQPQWLCSEHIREHDWLTGPVLLGTHGGPLDLSQVLEEREVPHEVEDERIHTTYLHGGNTAVRHRSDTMPAMLRPTEDLACVVGLYLAEGNFDAKRAEVQWTIHEDEEETLGKRLQQALDGLDAGQLRVYRRPGVTKGISLRLTNRPLAHFLHEVAGTGSREKALHPWIMLWPTDIQRTLLDAYWDGDGTQGDARRSFDTSSDELAQQVHALLVRQGHLPSWSRKENVGGPSNREAEAAMSNRVAYVPQRQYANGQRANGEGYYSMKVSGVETQPYSGMVYNLKVTGQESYVANGRITHNCSHALAVQYEAQARSGFDGSEQIHDDPQPMEWGEGVEPQYEHDKGPLPDPGFV